VTLWQCAVNLSPIATRTSIPFVLHSLGSDTAFEHDLVRVRSNSYDIINF